MALLLSGFLPYSIALKWSFGFLQMRLRVGLTAQGKSANWFYLSTKGLSDLQGRKA